MTSECLLAPKQEKGCRVNSVGDYDTARLSIELVSMSTSRGALDDWDVLVEDSTRPKSQPRGSVFQVSGEMS